MHYIHFILPNMMGLGQAATPKTAWVPHFQTSLSGIQAKIDYCIAGGGRSNSISTILTKTIQMIS
jgi:hypothetical protein